VKHKVAELEGALLDAAVALAIGDPRISLWGAAPWIDDGSTAGHGMTGRGFKPSSDWIDGGPIIERERIVMEPLEPRGVAPCDWSAFVMTVYGHEGPEGVARSLGATPLIAAMRAYVASKFGDEVELP
jgi:hypothetical protein